LKLLLCLAKTGVKSPLKAMFEQTNTRIYLQQRIMRSIASKSRRWLASPASELTIT